MGALEERTEGAVISRALERRNKTGVQRIVALNGGIAPAPRCRAVAALKLEEREEISRGIAAGRSVRRIARGLKRSPSTISRRFDETRRIGDHHLGQTDDGVERGAQARGSCWRYDALALKLALLVARADLRLLKPQFPTGRSPPDLRSDLPQSLCSTRGVLKTELITVACKAAAASAKAARPRMDRHILDIRLYPRETRRGRGSCLPAWEEILRACVTHIVTLVETPQPLYDDPLKGGAPGCRASPRNDRMSLQEFLEVGCVAVTCERCRLL